MTLVIWMQEHKQTLCSSEFGITGNSQKKKWERIKRKKIVWWTHPDRERGEWAAVGELVGCRGGKAMVCWLMAGMEHLMIICLFSDGLHGIAHLFYMSESPHVARTQHTHSQSRRRHTLTGKTSLYRIYCGYKLDTRKAKTCGCFDLSNWNILCFFSFWPFLTFTGLSRWSHKETVFLLVFLFIFDTAFGLRE